MKVLTTEQIREADAFTISREPVRSIDLMERAARGAAEYLAGNFNADRLVTIYAGYGNNGGDGIAMARMLAEAGRRVRLFLVWSEKGYSPDAQANINRLPSLENLTFTTILPELPLPVHAHDELLVDALFGSGLGREPEGFMTAIIDHINDSGCEVLAIDIPSGLFGEDNRLNSRKHVVKASQTLTFQFPKLAFFFHENYPCVGNWKVIPIGLHPDFIDQVETQWNCITRDTIGAWLKRRRKFDHKGTFGHALLICGSTGKTGAAVLAASACVRTGAGLTTVHVPAAGNGIVQTAIPEAMTDPDENPDIWTSVPELKNYQTIGIGPGIGVTGETWAALSRLLAKWRMPLVLDADALNLIARNPGSLLQIPKNSILTPHPGEYRRLFGEDPDDYSRVLRLREMAKTYHLIIVLKGAHSAVALPDGQVWFNTTGNPGMASGGSGDVLTGMITSLLAQGYEPSVAAITGVYLHGLAGDIAASGTGMEALTARDMIAAIGPAFLKTQSI